MVSIQIINTTNIKTNYLRKQKIYTFLILNGFLKLF